MDCRVNLTIKNWANMSESTLSLLIFADVMALVFLGLEMIT